MNLGVYRVSLETKLKYRVAILFFSWFVIVLPGCGTFHSYDGDVGHRDIALHFRSDNVIDQLWKQCGGETDVPAFAVRQDNGSCDVWMRPPKGEGDHKFLRLLYHELAHCEEETFGNTHPVAPDCAQEQ
ncbi:MAG TPA: hypothetical protein EYQ81_07560 [Sneathiellales bacterium]|nr:hypothetical protein [Sneathiellales bacterium]